MERHHTLLKRFFTDLKKRKIKLGANGVTLLSYRERISQKITLSLSFILLSVFSYAQCLINNTNTTSTMTSSSLVGQSFQASCSGLLSSIELQATSASPGLTLSIYSGEGTGGPVLGSTTFALVGSGIGNFESIDLTTEDIYLVDGEVYTLAISAGTPSNVIYSTTDDYSGGSFYSGGVVDLTADLVFQTNIAAYSLEACTFLYINTVDPGRAGADTEGHLDVSNCNLEPAAVSYLASTPTPVFYFNIANGSATAEIFGQFTIRSGNTVDLTSVLASAELFDGTNSRAGVISTDNIVFSGLAPDVGIIPAESEVGLDSDDGKEFALRVTFNSSLSAADQAMLDAQGLSFTFGGNTGDFADDGSSGSQMSFVWTTTPGWGTFAATTISNGTVAVTTSPTVQITGAPVSISSTAAFPITIQFSENVNNFVVGDIQVSNGSAGSFVSVNANTYTANITPDGSNNDVVISIPSGVADDGTHGNILATPVTVPAIPTLTSITRFNPSVTPTNADALVWRFTFTEPLLNFDASDFTINGTTATVTNIQDQTGGVYDVTLSGGNLNNLDGSVDISLNVSDITDADANALSSGTPTGTNNNSYVLDNTLDLSSVALNTPATSPTNADALTWRFTFTDVVSNLDASDFSIVGTTATISGISDQTGGVYDVSISGGDLPGLNATASISVNVSDIVDGVGNALSSGTPTGANNNSYVVDNLAPDLTSVELNTPASSPTNADALTWRFTFTEEVANLDATDFTVTGSTATVTGITDQTGGVYDVTISTGNLASLNGSVSIGVNVSDVTDQAGNPLSSGVPTTTNNNSYVVDNTAPDLTSVALNTPATSPTNADALTWRFTFTQEVSNLDATDFSIVGSTATVTGITDQTGGVYDVTISGGDLVNLNATVSISVNVSDITDQAGNALSSGTPTGANNNSYVVDNGLDLSSVVLNTPATSPTNADALTWRFTFTDVVTNLDATDFSITGSTATVTGITDQTGGVYDVTISGGDLAALNATVSIAVNVSDIVDAAGNALSSGTPTGTNNNSYEVDNASPTITDLNLFDTDFDGFIDRVDVVFDDIVDTDNSAAPVLGDFGIIRLPDNTIVSTGVVSSPSGSPSTVSITGITNQVTANNPNTAAGTASITGITAGDWVDDAGNAILATATTSTTVNDMAAPAIVDLDFYDNAGNGLIDEVIITWSEVTSATDGLLNDEFTGVITLPDGNTAIIGSYSGDGTTTMTLQTITGQLTEGTSILNTSADGDPVTFALDGLTTQFTDGANATSNPDDNETYTDSANPILVGSTPQNGTTVGVATNLILEFSERIAAGSGNVTITDETNGDDTQAFAIGSGTIDSTTVFFNPADLTNGENYSIQVATTAVNDLETLPNVYGGISDNLTLTFSTVVSSPLNAGDVAFTGYNAERDQFSLVVLQDIFGSITPQEIRLTDEEWDGGNSVFENTSNNDGELVWTINVDIVAGTVVLFDEVETNAPTVSVGLIALGDATDMNLETSNDAIFAYVGTSLTGVSAILTGMATDNTNAGAWGDEGLMNSGLIEGTNAIAFNALDVDLDGANYIGSRSGENDFADYTAFLFDPVGANWETADGGSTNPTLDLTVFTIDANAPLIASIDFNTPATSPTNANTLVWDVTFSDLVDGGAAGTSVSNVDATDFTVSGGTTATVTNVTGSNLAYQVTVSGGDLATFDGTVTLGFAGGQNISDGAGNLLDVGGSTPSPNNDTYTVDNTPPGFGTNSISNADIQGFDINVQLDQLGDVYWVVVADGALAPSAAQVVAGQDNSGAAALDAGTINIDVASATRTGTASGLASNTPFDVYIVGEDNAGNLQASATLLNATTAAPDATSDVGIAAAFETAAGIDYATAGNQVTDITNIATQGSRLTRIQVRDFANADGSPTIITDITLNISGFANVRQLALYDGTTEVGEVTVTNGTPSFTGLNFSTPDGGTGNLDVYATFQASVTDNVNIVVELNDGDVTVSGTGSSNLTSPISGGTSDGSGTNNQIQVTASTYAFVVQPSDVTQDIAMSPTVQVEAVDNLGNRDLDYNENIPPASITSNGTLSGTVNAAILSGIGVTDPITHTVAQTNRTLTVTGTLGAVASNQFTVRGLDGGSNAQLVTGGETVDIDYAANQQTDLTSATGVSLAFIDITDAGTQDQIATILTDLQLSITNHTYLRQLAIYDDLNNELAEITVSGATANFTGMSFSVPDGTTERLTLRGSFTTTVVDNQRVSFTVTGATAQSTGSSNFGGGTVGGTSSTAGQDNQIEVTTTQLIFSSIETVRFVNETFTATIQAVDGNTNIDLDDNSAFTINLLTSGSTAPASILSGTTNPSFVNGEVTISNLAIDQELSPHTLEANDGGPLTDGTANINITTPRYKHRSGRQCNH